MECWGASCGWLFLDAGPPAAGSSSDCADLSRSATPPSIRAEAGKRRLPASFAPQSQGLLRPLRPHYRGQTLDTARIVAHATQRGLVSRAPGRRRITSTASPPRLCHCFLRVWLSVQRPSSHGNSRRPGL